MQMKAELDELRDENDNLQKIIQNEKENNKKLKGERADLTLKCEDLQKKLANIDQMPT